MTSAPSFRILAIEDDPRMLDLLRRGLWERGHSVVTATTAKDGESLALAHPFDVVLLDIGLPDRSGYTVAESLRKRTDCPAIVMLTARNREDQIVDGLDRGADDYIAKPFSFPELLARIDSVSRRARLAKSDEIRFGDLVLDLKKRRLMRGYEPVALTRSEYLLLRELALYRGEAVPRRRLMNAVWATTQVSHGSLDTLMGTLREKIEPGAPELIATVRGLGYCLQPNPTSAERSEP